MRPEYATQAIDHFFDMVNEGKLINISSVLHILRACAEVSDIKSAVECIKVMRHKNFEPNKYIYNAMFRCYASACAIPDLEVESMELFINDAWKLLEEVGRRKLIDVKILNNFMSMYVFAMRGE